jgi:hypothetical protein
MEAAGEHPSKADAEAALESGSSRPDPYVANDVSEMGT